jgi:putative salt-induced outer membrane protein YdiY
MSRFEKRARTIVLGLLVALACGAAAAQAPDDDWNPQSTFEGKFDWIQMTSGEWVKGEIIVMYDDDLEFDSDEFDDLVLGWDDIRQIHSAQMMTVGFVDHTSAVGILVVDGDDVTVIGDEITRATRAEVLSLTAGAPKEINFWSMKLFFGLIVRSGNSDVRDLSIQGNFKRRTIENRVVVDIIVNQNTTDGEEIANNQRASASWDRFITRRFFVNPVFGEYLHDPFQNIDARYTIGVGAGYQLLDSPKVDWDVSGGPAYQETRFDDVLPEDSVTESTPALVVSTTTDWDITKWLEFDGQYRFQIVNEESGSYNHHLLASFETEITKRIDFDVSWIWDRIKKPRQNSNGSFPEQNDIRTTVGLTFEF